MIEVTSLCLCSTPSSRATPVNLSPANCRLAPDMVLEKPAEGTAASSTGDLEKEPRVRSEVQKGLRVARRSEGSMAESKQGTEGTKEVEVMPAAKVRGKGCGDCEACTSEDCQVCHLCNHYHHFTMFFPIQQFYHHFQVCINCKNKSRHKKCVARICKVEERSSKRKR